jgi:hypothetical protein
MPNKGAYLEFEIFSSTSQAPLSAFEIDKYNYYPYYQKSVYTKGFAPSTYLNGTLTPNLAFKLLVNSEKKTFKKIKRAKRAKIVSDKRKERIFKRLTKKLKPQRDTINYPNNSPIALLKTLQKIDTNNDALTQVIFYLYRVDKKRYKTYIRLLDKGELKMHIPQSVINEAIFKIQNDSNYLHITPFLTIQIDEKNHVFLLNFIKTSDGWIIVD